MWQVPKTLIGKWLKKIKQHYLKTYVVWIDINLKWGLMNKVWERTKDVRVESIFFQVFSNGCWPLSHHQILLKLVEMYYKAIHIGDKYDIINHWIISCLKGRPPILPKSHFCWKNFLATNYNLLVVAIGITREKSNLRT